MSLFRFACFALAGSLLSTAADAASGVEVCKLFRAQQWQPVGEMGMGECLRLIAATESAQDGSELRFGFWGDTPLAASDQGYFRSDNGGRRWTPLPASSIPPPPAPAVAAVAPAPGPASSEPVPPVAPAPVTPAPARKLETAKPAVPPPAEPVIATPPAAAVVVPTPPAATQPKATSPAKSANKKNEPARKTPAPAAVAVVEPAAPPAVPLAATTEAAQPAAVPAPVAAPAPAPAVDKLALAEAKRQQDEARRAASAAVPSAPPASPTVVTQAANNVALVPPPAPAAPSAKTATPATVGSLASCDLRIGRRWQSLDQTSFEACVDALAGTASGEYDANGLKHGYWGGTFLIADRTAIYRSVDGNAWVKLRDRAAP